MATYVNDLRLTELATGEGSGTWGVTTNTNLELIGEALGYGTQDCFASDADATTTVADGASDPARAMYFKVTSSASLTATRTLTIAPNTVSRVMLIENATTGSQSIAISQGSGGNVTIANGAVKMVYLDGAGAGAAVVDALADLELGTITVANLTATTADINGGTIDGATIGGASAAAGTFTNLTATGTTTLAGASTSADITFGDNDKAIFGAGSDLQIYHDASNSYIIDNGTGSLFIRGNSQIQLQDTNTAGKFFVGTAGGAATLYHNNAAKLATTATGIDVTGTVTADGLTVDTETLHVDAASNRIGIGTTNPAYLIDAQTAAGNAQLSVTAGGDLAQLILKSTDTTGNSQINFADADSSNVGMLQYFHNDNHMEFTVNGSEAMRITSAGNVGIGTSSPDAQGGNQSTILNLEGSDNLVYFSGGSGGNAIDDGLAIEGVATGVSSGDKRTGSILMTRANTSTTSLDSKIAFYTTSSGTHAERMRLDSSGNLLVGTTVLTDISSSGTGNEGAYIKPDGQVGLATSNDKSLIINRKTTDGDLIEFRKDGATVGSIGTDTSRFKVKSSSLALYLENESNKQLVWGNVSSVPYFYPQSDNDTNLGYPTQRFKDLYLSGGVYLGGTGAANLLDDYEEGTWTSSTTSNNLTTYGAFTGRYTKVGNIVHLSGQLAGISAGTGNRFFEFTAPFNQYAAINISIGVCNNYPRGNRRSGQVIDASSGNTTGFYVTWNNDSSQSSDIVRFQITYETT